MTGNNTWQNKVAIVTGGISGIGKAVALELIRHGAKVVITGRNMDRLAEVAGDSAAIEAVQADAADPATGAVLVKRALARWGQIDLIVNNAGAGQPMPLPAYDAEAISQMGAVNITAPSMLVKAGAETLKASKGAIVNIGTAVSRKDAPMMAHYAASKAALEHLTRAWALEFARDGVRVNAIAPGPVKTGALTGMKGLPAEMAAQIEAQEAEQIPLGRRGVTEDIVPWVLRLGSAENAWLTGQILTVDGGWTLRE